MGKLAFSVGKVVGKDKMTKSYTKSQETEFDLSKAIKCETVEYQVESIPKFFFEDNAADSNKRRQQTLALSLCDSRN